MPQTLWFLLLPGFSMMGLMSAIEPCAWPTVFAASSTAGAC